MVKRKVVILRLSCTEMYFVGESYNFVLTITVGYAPVHSLSFTVHVATNCL